MIASARRTIDEEKGKAAAELKAQVADLAVAAATRIVKSSLDDKAQRALVEEYLRELPAGRN
jgi:F-type H+-transporting ATPase subunit b